MGKRGVKKNQKSKNAGENFALGEIFAQGCEIASVLFFFSSFPYDFRSAKLGSTQILHAWAHSKNLALIACKNYKISHKM